MVLCPLSVTDSWMSEFAKFCPILRVLKYLGDKERRRDLRRMMHEHVQKQPPSINVSHFLILVAVGLLAFVG